MTTRLEQIKARLAKATQGRWVRDIDDLAVWTPDYLLIADCAPISRSADMTEDQQGANADLIAHAGGTDGDLAWLVARYEASLKADFPRERELVAIAEAALLVKQTKHLSSFWHNVDALSEALAAYQAAKESHNG